MSITKAAQTSTNAVFPLSISGLCVPVGYGRAALYAPAPTGRRSRPIEATSSNGGAGGGDNIAEGDRVGGEPKHSSRGLAPSLLGVSDVRALGSWPGVGMMMGMGTRNATARPMSQDRAGMWTSHDVSPGGHVDVVVREDPGPDALRAWDLLVDRTPGTDVTQLSVWAGLRGRVGFTPRYLLAYRGDELVGGAQILTRRVPVLGVIGYLPYGPLVAPDTAAAADVQRALVDALVALGQRRLRILFVQPPEGAQDTSDELRHRGFRPSSAGIAPQGSIRIDLTADLAEIRSRFGKRLKSWTNRWESRGVTVRVGDKRDIPLLAELMASSAQHKGYTQLRLASMR